MSRPTGPAQPQYTVANQESGKDTHAYPTHVELYCRTPQHHLHCYKAEAEFLYAIFFLIKLNWLDNEDLGVLSMIFRLQSDGNLYSKIAAGRLHDS
jgi:hypothetical protein